MKCIKKDGEKIRRVGDDKAKEMVETEGWSYCPKSEWKAQERG